MARHLRLYFSSFMRRRERIVLAFGWFIGLGFGFYLSHISVSSVSLMRMALSEPVSIVGVLGVTFFPLFISATAVFLSVYHLLPVIAAAKAVPFGFVLSTVWQTFGNGAPLAYALCCFSELCTVPLLMFFWFRYSDRRPMNARDAFVFFSLSAVISCIDIWIISPFVGGL